MTRADLVAFLWGGLVGALGAWLLSRDLFWWGWLVLGGGVLLAHLGAWLHCEAQEIDALFQTERD